MTELDLKINTLLMEEMGLEEGDRRRLIDQDTGLLYQMKGKDIVSPGSQGGKQAIEFDPINNKRMMTFLFGNYINKISDEDDVDVQTYYITQEDKDERVRGTLTFEDNSSIITKPYRNETTCYAELLLRLNGEEDVDLTEYDIDRRKAPQSVKPPKKKKTTKPKKPKEEKKDE